MRTHIRFFQLLSLCLLASLSLSCGGGSMSTTATSSSTPQPQLVGISGTWLFTLSYDQSALTGGHGSGQGTATTITMPLTQDVTGTSSSISSPSPILGSDLGCRVGLTTWAAFGSFRTSNFTFISGSLQSPTVNVALTEFANPLVPPPQPLPTGQLTFTGTLNPDGSMSGTLTDTCFTDLSGHPMQGTWTAMKN